MATEAGKVMSNKHRDEWFVGNASEFQDRHKGYFLGHFMGKIGYPALNYEGLEIAWKQTLSSFDDKPHYHLHSTEITIVLSGRLTVELDQRQEIQLRKGDFVLVPPGTVLQNLSAEEGTEVITMKFPSVSDDKFYAE
jgi:mannose-6-phosphate isomerase-like protein (cupin superfamily)